MSSLECRHGALFYHGQEKEPSALSGYLFKNNFLFFREKKKAFDDYKIKNNLFALKSII